MKIVEKKKPNKKDKLKKNLVKPKKAQVLIVAQEIKFGRLLSSNESKTRDRALKSLRKWLQNCFQKGHVFNESDFSRIWKGLFYAMWMSDKPLVQEELCETISSLLDEFPPHHLANALLLVKTGFKTLATEWYGIDQHRMDKFLMLVRRYLRGSLRCLKRCNWSDDSCQQYADMLTGSDGLLALNTPAYARNSTSMILHIIDCFLEELSKVSSGSIPESSMSALLRPFCSAVCLGAGARAVASRRLLTALLRQSAPGIEYGQKRSAWEKMGCPKGGPDALELVSDDEEPPDEESIAEESEDGDETGPLDPRAGRVNVNLHPLPVPAKEIADILRELVAKAPSTNQKRARICLQRFTSLSTNIYPLRDSLPPSDLEPAPPALPAARRLRALELKLAADTDELRLRGLSRKHRKRLLAKTRAGLSIVEEVEKFRSSNGDWNVEDATPKTDNAVENRKRKLEKQNGDKKRQKNKKDSPKKKVLEDTKTVKNNISVTENKKKTKKIKSTNIIEESSPPKKIKLSKSDENKKGLNKKTIQKVNGIEKKHSQPNTPKIIKDDKTHKQNEKPQKQKESTVKNKMSAEKLKMDAQKSKKVKNPTLVTNKLKNFQKQLSPKSPDNSLTPKRVKFVLKNNSMQAPVDYFKSVRQSPNIPFDSNKIPVKTNLKPSTPSPINPFFKKKLRLK